MPFLIFKIPIPLPFPRDIFLENDPRGVCGDKNWTAHLKTCVYQIIKSGVWKLIREHVIFLICDSYTLLVDFKFSRIWIKDVNIAYTYIDFYSNLVTLAVLVYFLYMMECFNVCAILLNKKIGFLVAFLIIQQTCFLNVV